jgi:hypothetical protein
MNKIVKYSILAAIPGGILAGITYVAAYDSLSQASVILGYGPGFIPTLTTMAVVIVYIGCILAYKYLESFASGIIQSIITDSEEEDEEE